MAIRRFEEIESWQDARELTQGIFAPQQQQVSSGEARRPVGAAHPETPGPQGRKMDSEGREPW